jgi:hypothetical protein
MVFKVSNLFFGGPNGTHHYLPQAQMWTTVDQDIFLQNKYPTYHDIKRRPLCESRPAIREFFAARDVEWFSTWPASSRAEKIKTMAVSSTVIVLS